MGGLCALACLVGVLVIIVALWIADGRVPSQPWVPMRLVAPRADLVCVVEILPSEPGRWQDPGVVVEVLRGVPPREPFYVPSLAPDLLDPDLWGWFQPGERVLAFLDTSGDELREAVPGSSVYPDELWPDQYGARTFEDVVESARELLRAQDVVDATSRRAAEVDWLVSACERGLAGAFADLRVSAPTSRPHAYYERPDVTPEWDVVAELDDAQLDRLVSLVADRRRPSFERASLALVLVEHDDRRLDAEIAHMAAAVCEGASDAGPWFWRSVDLLTAAARYRLGLHGLDAGLLGSQGPLETLDPDSNSFFAARDEILGEAVSLLR